MTVPSDVDLDKVASFCKGTVSSYLRQNGEFAYPGILVQEMRDLNLFGISIAPEYGGTNVGATNIGMITELLGFAWQPLAGMLGTHIRACSYVQRIGTARQKQHFLPAMATGEAIFAHAYHERGRKDLNSFRTRLRMSEKGYQLSGRKDWVTTALTATHMIVIGALEKQLVAAVVQPTQPGIAVTDYANRSGMHGVSLASVEFDSVHVDREWMLGDAADVKDFIVGNEASSSLAFAARAVGSAEALVAEAQGYLRRTIQRRSARATGAIGMRCGELETCLASMRGTLLGARLDPERVSAHAAKVHCTRTLQEVVALVTSLLGGEAYTDNALVARHARDARALTLIDTPDDVLLSRLGANSLQLQVER